MKARLIGERNAGMTAVEIFDGEDNLVWANQWFDNGCTTSGYIDGLCDAFDCMHQCDDVEMFDGGQIDDDGKPVAIDTEATTGVMLEYATESGWSLGEDARTLGQQSSEIIDACMAAGLIEADDYHEDNAYGEVVAAIAKHIKDREKVAQVTQ